MSETPMQREHDRRPSDASPRLVDLLQSLLERQMELAQQGKLTAVHALAEQAGEIVERLGGDEVPGSAGLETGKAAVEDSYRRLSLMLAAERDDVHEELNRLRRARRFIRTYRERMGRS